MKHICLLFLGSLACLALAMPALSDTFNWGYNQVTIRPDLPTTRDVVTVAVDGSWGRGCAPYRAEGAVGSPNGTTGVGDVTFGVIDDYACSYCVEIVVPWHLGTSLGSLRAGKYDLYALVAPWCGGPPFPQPPTGGPVIQPGDGDFLGAFQVREVGDVDGNGSHDVFDVIDVVSAFGSSPGYLGWNAHCDFNHNGIVDIFDVIDTITIGPIEPW